MRIHRRIRGVRGVGGVGGVGATTAVLVLLLVSHLPAIAQAAEHRDGDLSPSQVDELLAEHAGLLGIGAETLEQIRELYAEHRDATSGLREDLRTARQALRQRMEEDSPSESQVHAQADAIGALSTQLHRSSLSLRLGIRGLLTKEQIEAVAFAIEKRRERRQRARHWREHRRRGD